MPPAASRETATGLFAPNRQPQQGQWWWVWGTVRQHRPQKEKKKRKRQTLHETNAHETDVKPLKTVFTREITATFRSPPDSGWACAQPHTLRSHDTPAKSPPTYQDTARRTRCTSSVVKVVDTLRFLKPDPFSPDDGPVRHHHDQHHLAVADVETRGSSLDLNSREHGTVLGI